MIRIGLLLVGFSIFVIGVVTAGDIVYRSAEEMIVAAQVMAGLVVSGASILTVTLWALASRLT